MTDSHPVRDRHFHLRRLCAMYREVPGMDALAARIPAPGAAAAGDADEALYAAAVPLVEQGLWQAPPDAAALDCYQGMFRDHEDMLPESRQAQRHVFTVVIPVADRPTQLATCLDSLLQQCRLYAYGGLRDGAWHKVSALIVDDSREPANRVRHAELARDCCAQGLQCTHLSPGEQRSLLRRLAQRTPLDCAGLPPLDDADFAHKGASVTRNVALLQLATHGTRDRDRLYHFIDSDQTFEVNVATADGDVRVAGLNYFWHLDRIFRDPAVEVLTGKVVGDPPVSPAVMAGTFLDDVDACLRSLAGADPHAPCIMHDDTQREPDGAAYHDMADLFGFRRGRETFPYRCELRGKHDTAAGFARFAAVLPHFFYGEHPTRVSHYRHSCPQDGTQPARTVYTGNYVLRATALRYYIPFADLRLRMAGPVLGRIVRAEIDAGFVSANLPLLHRRTLDSTGKAEFRHGIVADDGGTDLGDEFERQFFGDVLLFTVDALVHRGGYPGTLPGEAQLDALLDETCAQMLLRYQAKHAEIGAAIARLDLLFEAPAHWWHTPQLAAASADVRRFLAHMRHNFGAASAAYARVGDELRRADWIARLRAALVHFAGERESWERLLAAAGGADRMD